VTRTATQAFLCAFTAQAGFLTLAPILPDVAAEFGTSSPAVGQLRTLSGLAGGALALLLFLSPRSPGIRTILRGSLALAATGSALSAVAPSIAVLAVGQAAVGAAGAGLMAGSVAAAARWPAAPERARTLTWAIVGQPAAWVVGMPVTGVVADLSWRLTWVALPMTAAVVALWSLRGRPTDAPERRARAAATQPLAGWAAAELLAQAAWAGTLVYSAVLLRDSYDVSATAVGLMLGVGAAAYFPGAFGARALNVSWRAGAVAAAAVLAAGVGVFGALRPSPLFSGVLFGLLVGVAGARTTLASSYLLELAPEIRTRASGIRAAATQFGYLIGAAVAGLALAVGGFAEMGAVLAALLVASIVPHVAALRSAAAPTSLDTVVSRFGRVLRQWPATTSTPSVARSSSSTAAWAPPSSSST